MRALNAGLECSQRLLAAASRPLERRAHACRASPHRPPQRAMASLTASIGDVSSPAGRLQAARALTDAVYGLYDSSKAAAAPWRPLPYADNKSRYLWTDAFGVCNFITLACETGEARYLDQV